MYFCAEFVHEGIVCVVHGAVWLNRGLGDTILIINGLPGFLVVTCGISLKKTLTKMPWIRFE